MNNRKLIKEMDEVEFVRCRSCKYLVWTTHDENRDISNFICKDCVICRMRYKQELISKGKYINLNKRIK